MGFEPTCRFPGNPLSRRARYDHFGTSPRKRQCRSPTEGASIAALDRAIHSARRTRNPGSHFGEVSVIFRTSSDLCRESTRRCWKNITKKRVAKTAGCSYINSRFGTTAEGGIPRFARGGGIVPARAAGTELGSRRTSVDSSRAGFQCFRGPSGRVAALRARKNERRRAADSVSRSAPAT